MHRSAILCNAVRADGNFNGSLKANNPNGCRFPIGSIVVSKNLNFLQVTGPHNRPAPGRAGIRHGKVPRLGQRRGGRLTQVERTPVPGLFLPGSKSKKIRRTYTPWNGWPLPSGRFVPTVVSDSNKAFLFSIGNVAVGAFSGSAREAWEEGDGR